MMCDIIKLNICTNYKCIYYLQEPKLSILKYNIYSVQ